jgi:hypothetical protein
MASGTDIACRPGCLLADCLLAGCWPADSEVLG